MTSTDINPIQSRIKTAEQMPIDFICNIYNKKVKDMTAGESVILEFFLRYHPDAFKAIDDYVGS